MPITVSSVQYGLLSQMVNNGMTVKQAAQAEFVALRTANRRLQQLRTQLNAATTADLKAHFWDMVAEANG